MPYEYKGNGKWEEVYDNPSEGRPNRPPANSNINNTQPPDLSDTSNKDTTESTNKSNSEFIEIEQNVLVGDVNVVPNPNYRAKATVLLQYLGKNLTGLYFVDRVTHSFSNSGYSQSLSVSRNGFGDTIKSGSAVKPVDKVAPTEGGLMNGSKDDSRPPESTPPPKPLPQKVSINPSERRTVISATPVKEQASANSKTIGEVYPGGWLTCEEKENGYYKMWYVTYAEYGSKKKYGYVPVSQTKPI